MRFLAWLLDLPEEMYHGEYRERLRALTQDLEPPRVIYAEPDQRHTARVYWWDREKSKKRA